MKNVAESIPSLPNFLGLTETIFCLRVMEKIKVNKQKKYKSIIHQIDAMMLFFWWSGYFCLLFICLFIYLLNKAYIISMLVDMYQYSSISFLSLVFLTISF